MKQSLLPEGHWPVNTCRKMAWPTLRVKSVVSDGGPKEGAYFSPRAARACTEEELCCILKLKRCLPGERETGGNTQEQPKQRVAQEWGRGCSSTRAWAWAPRTRKDGHSISHFHFTALCSCPRPPQSFTKYVNVNASSCSLFELTVLVMV